MGIIWGFAMPLLSTLAALVIIVHSAEEDRESDYRRELRPRVLDTGTPTYDRDESWRVLDTEPVIQRSTQSNTWPDNSVEELPKHRKTGRKRKRRPQTLITDDLVPHETYPEEPPRPYFDVDLSNTQQTTEIPRRRRKKITSRPNVWTVEAKDTERSLQRRGQRKKRPSLEPWPRLSEFSGYRREEMPFEVATEPSEQMRVDDNSHDNENLQEHFVQKNLENYDELVNPGHETDKEEDNLFYRRPHLKENKDLSEFSYEVMTSLQEPKEDAEPKHEKEKLLDKSYGTLNAYDKAQDKCTFPAFHAKLTSNIWSQLQPNKMISKKNYQSFKHILKEVKAHEKITKSMEANMLTYDTEVKVHEENALNLEELDYLRDDIYIMDNSFIDPVTLKDILKRSNGTSLSEILQYHNLSLSDLLHGKGNAISIFKSEDSAEKKYGLIQKDLSETKPNDKTIKDTPGITSEEKLLINLETKYVTELGDEYATTTQSTRIIEEENNDLHMTSTTTVKPEENIPKILARRRFPPGIRRKLRMRPTMNTTYKGQLSRDLIALNAKKYLQHRRNVTKLKEWKSFAPSVINVNTTENYQKKQDIETTTIILTDEATIEQFTGDIQPFITTEKSDDNNRLVSKNKNAGIAIVPTTTINTDIIADVIVNVTDKPTVTHTAKRPVNNLGIRRQAFNDGSKKKRLRQKNSSSKPPNLDNIDHLIEIPNVFSTSEYIPVTHMPEIISEEEKELFTGLEDFITTQNPKRRESRIKSTRITSANTLKPPVLLSTTEETSKVEIEEIFNDTQTSERLSRILLERNMTLSELVEHRERGSSYVHLADIFHNASKEPNPSEPFLSKSFIEPISKKTYPLRAILEANIHEATVKATTIDPNIIDTGYVNIPVVMDFGNNVNENAETMGIMSLFNNLTKTEETIIHNNNGITKVSEGSPYKAEISAMNTTQLNNTHETDRESKMLSEISQDDVVSWKEIFSLMRKNYKNETKDILLLQSLQNEPSESIKKITLEEDIDGDGLILFEDLQHLNDFDSNIVSDAKVEVGSVEKSEEPTLGILQKIPNQTKSVTVATASIAGLAMILFLLTYAAFKWKQQRVFNSNKHSLGNERIPTPVFEKRKGDKNSCSTRSMSPMLSTSNIYTLNTLDSHNGKESPDYMWDTLRKPFQ